MLKIDTGSKFKMAAAAILKITFLAMTRPFLHAFAPNLKHMLKMGPTVRFTAKIHTVQKSKMAAAAILKSVKWPYLRHF